MYYFMQEFHHVFMHQTWGMTFLSDIQGGDEEEDSG